MTMADEILIEESLDNFRKKWGVQRSGSHCATTEIGICRVTGADGFNDGQSKWEYPGEEMVKIGGREVLLVRN